MINSPVYPQDERFVAYADGRTQGKPSEVLIDRAMRQYLDGTALQNGTVRWSYLRLRRHDSEDTIEGPRAFAEKRRPNWTSR